MVRCKAIAGLALSCTPFSRACHITIVLNNYLTFYDAHIIRLILLQWKDKVNKMMHKIKSMTVGGKVLRDAIDEEVGPLKVLRMELFCTFADGYQSGSQKDETRKSK